MTTPHFDPGLETKVQSATTCEFEIRSAFDEFLHAFDDFKKTNDERLGQLEQRQSEDVVTTDKLDRINSSLDEQKGRLEALMTKQARPHRLPAGRGVDNFSQKSAAFDGFARTGAISTKSYALTGSDHEGFLAPAETETSILGRLTELSPIRQIASVRQVSGSVYKKPFAVEGLSAGWVGESDVRGETSSGKLAEMAFPTMELYAMPAASQTLLDDSAVDMDAWIAEEVHTAFAEQETAAFVSGDGVTRPQGFMTANFVDESSWSWGNLGRVTTGVSGGFDATAPADALVDLIYALKAGYRQNARFVMNRKTQAEIRKIKDADGNYIWQPSQQPGGAASLFNFAITESEDMPDISASATAIAFGDFQRGYLIVDRIGVRILRDPYSAKPYVLFYTTKRVGGGIQDFDAIKGMTFSG